MAEALNSSNTTLEWVEGTERVPPIPHCCVVLSNSREESWILDQPNLDEIQELMQECLEANFSDVQVNVVKCPDLRVFPYHLAASGLCGHAEVIEFGNHKHLYNPSKDKGTVWNLPALTSKIYKKNSSFVIGGSIKGGINPKEFVINLKYLRRYRSELSNYPSGINNRSHCVFINEEMSARKRILNEAPMFCNVHGSVFVCGGKRKYVLEIYAKKAHNSDRNILDLMREALYERYFNARVGLSGTFYIKSGMVEATVMPSTFPETHLQTPTEIYDWGHKCHISAPLVVYSTMFNFDELEIEMNSKRRKFCTVNDSSNQILPTRDGIGGSLLKALTPDMEYKGYFNVVSKLHRVGYEIDSEEIFDYDSFSESDS